MAKSVPKSEQDWQAEDDARTLQRAEEIKGDGKRLTRAMKALKTQAKEARETAARIEGMKFKDMVRRASPR